MYGSRIRWAVNNTSLSYNIMLCAVTNRHWSMWNCRSTVYSAFYQAAWVKCLLYNSRGERDDVANSWWCSLMRWAALWEVLCLLLCAHCVSYSIDTDQRQWGEQHLPHEYARGNVLFSLWVHLSLEIHCCVFTLSRVFSQPATFAKRNPTYLA